MTKAELIEELGVRMSTAGDDRRAGIGMALTAIEHDALADARVFLIESYCFDEADLVTEYMDNDDCSGFVPGWN